MWCTYEDYIKTRKFVRMSLFPKKNTLFHYFSDDREYNTY